jgi:inactivated superfamily I helicase
MPKTGWLLFTCDGEAWVGRGSRVAYLPHTGETRKYLLEFLSRRWGEKFQLEGTDFPLTLMARLVFLTEYMRIHVTDPNTVVCLLQHPCVQRSVGRKKRGPHRTILELAIPNRGMESQAVGNRVLVYGKPVDKVVVPDRPAATLDREKIGLGRSKSGNLRFEEQILFLYAVLFLPHLYDLRAACFQHDKGTIEQNHILVCDERQ